VWTPQTYSLALALMVLSMLCWGTWDNTQKIDRSRRFELYYWDYIWGILICVLIVGFTLGSTDRGSRLSFAHSLGGASASALGEAFAGGVIWNFGNLLLVAAISIAGMAVAFPIGSGLSLVIGVVLNYLLKPVGNPVLLFGGVALICLAIVADALAYGELSEGKKAGTRGIMLSLICGVVLGFFYPFVARSMNGAQHLSPYAASLVFVAGALVCTIPFDYLLMRRPVTGSPLRMRDYLRGGVGQHAWGVVGGLVWGVGTIASYIVANVPLVGPAVSFSMSQGNTMISALWGVLVWKEFRGARTGVRKLLILMFALFVAGLAAIGLSPAVRF
jgi:glucose uptake protein